MLRAVQQTLETGMNSPDSVNGRQVSAEIEDRTSLADFLRSPEQGCTSVHLGCEHGVRRLHRHHRRSHPAVLHRPGGGLRGLAGRDPRGTGRG